jgi:N-acetylneuraminate synthase
MIGKWGIPVGFSDHTLGSTAAVVAVSLGATIVEKHLTLRRSDGGPDAAFSSEPGEFAQLVRDVDAAYKALGTVRFGPSPTETASLRFRRSLRIVEEIRAGDVLSEKHVRSVRPSGGLLPSRISEVLGRRVTRDLCVGDPLTDDCVEWF